MFIYEGYRVKVKVTGAKQVKQTRPVPSSHTFQNVDTPVGVSAGSALPEIWLPPRHCRLATCLDMTSVITDQVTGSKVKVG